MHLTTGLSVQRTRGGGFRLRMPGKARSAVTVVFSLGSLGWNLPILAVETRATFAAVFN